MYESVCVFILLFLFNLNLFLLFQKYSSSLFESKKVNVYFVTRYKSNCVRLRIDNAQDSRVFREGMLYRGKSFKFVQHGMPYMPAALIITFRLFACNFGCNSYRYNKRFFEARELAFCSHVDVNTGSRIRCKRRINKGLRA